MDYISAAEAAALWAISGRSRENGPSGGFSNAKTKDI